MSLEADCCCWRASSAALESSPAWPAWPSLAALRHSREGDCTSPPALHDSHTRLQDIRGSAAQVGIDITVPDNTVNRGGWAGDGRELGS